MKQYSEDEKYDPNNVLQINLKNGNRKYQCKKCKTKYQDPFEAGCCCSG